MRNMQRETWLAVVTVFSAAALALSAIATPAAAAVRQDYPNKAVRIIVLNSPGSGADILTRTISSKFTEAWGQQVIVDNRAGAGGNIGLEIGARSVPDGYTLVMLTSQQAIVVGLYEKVNYDLIKDCR